MTMPFAKSDGRWTSIPCRYERTRWCAPADVHAAARRSPRACETGPGARARFRVHHCYAGRRVRRAGPIRGGGRAHEQGRAARRQPDCPGPAGARARRGGPERRVGEGAANRRRTRPEADTSVPTKSPRSTSVLATWIRPARCFARERRSTPTAWRGLGSSPGSTHFVRIHATGCCCATSALLPVRVSGG